MYGEAIRRSLPYIPINSPSLQHLAAKLHAREGLTITAIGMSTTREFAGSDHLLYGSTRGWGKTLISLLNATFPHSRHQFYNRARGLGNPQLVTTCIASHLAPGTDILIVDFNLRDWRIEEQEHMARTIAAMQRPPLTIFMGCRNGAMLLQVCRTKARNCGELDGLLSARHSSG